jgi:hypothetical protein
MRYIVLLNDLTEQEQFMLLQILLDAKVRNLGTHQYLCALDRIAMQLRGQLGIDLTGNHLDLLLKRKLN